MADLKIRIIGALLPLDMGDTIYVTKTVKDLQRIAKMSKHKEPAIRYFIKNGVVIFWDAYKHLHQEVINRAKDFDKDTLERFGLIVVDLDKWQRGSIGFVETGRGLQIADIDPRTAQGEKEILNFIKRG